MIARKSKTIWEFGDFQTPSALAMEVVTTLRRYGINPFSIIEPTCGKGNLLIHALRVFHNVEHAIGADINKQYLEVLQKQIELENISISVTCINTDFFITQWSSIIDQLVEPILILGNPPWVTSSDLGAIQSANVPEKSNFQGYAGWEALMGKSNFDISEWMLLQNIEWLQSRHGTIAMLCKTMVARKVLLAAWNKNKRISSAKIFRIDAKKHFNASVDACLLIININQGVSDHLCQFFASLSSLQPESFIGYRNKTMIPNIATYDELAHLLGGDTNYIWRSGIKHDCAKVMELDRSSQGFIAGGNAIVDIEDEFLFPLLKSSDVGNNRVATVRKWLLVTQKCIGEDTKKIEALAPKTWEYLHSHRRSFIKRGSSVYRNRPDFSIFGVGDYAFTDWKVAISGFYKRLAFVIVGPVAGKPVVFDDTVYFLSCFSQAEAEFIACLLRSELATTFYNSLIFWEDKRPITIDVLKKLNLRSLARAYGQEDVYISFVLKRSERTAAKNVDQLRLLETEEPYNANNE
ncbi:SAM-dependent methyltransferase [Candidatus Viridilinea mediisalina]|uniref:SAM-dependent methyltransferase n=1 Tax=Candidatus Viridilinea mediisalina TaxID=2024553 RepID=A0A2A6RMF2_9CHLR|nr:SAM-dependent methyltransferase [Candidatus Viridilinea mediisalina]PDW04081.1 SAM-dependent methyltransferase [Candidatus Viridilinea mediisalina]